MPQRPREDQIPHVLWPRHELLHLIHRRVINQLTPAAGHRLERVPATLRAVRRRTVLLLASMLFSALLIACGGSPTVSIATAPMGDVPTPGGLQDAAQSEMSRSIQICYEAALKTQANLKGRVEFDVVGSHGILKPEAIGKPHPALSTCVREALGDSRLQRKLGDGPNQIGFELTVDFSP